jgi:hypothetical protein
VGAKNKGSDGEAARPFGLSSRFDSAGTLDLNQTTALLPVSSPSWQLKIVPDVLPGNSIGAGLGQVGITCLPRGGLVVNVWNHRAPQFIPWFNFNLVELSVDDGRGKPSLRLVGCAPQQRV